MRILIDATAAVSGGQVYLAQLLPRLLPLAAAHEFIILHGDACAGLAEQLAAPHVRWLRVASANAGEREWIFAAMRKLLWRSVMLLWHVWRARADVFFSNAGTAPGGLPRRIALVLALHNSMPLRPELIAAERSRLRRWRLQALRHLQARAIRRAGAVICFSADTRQRVQASYLPTARTALPVIYHGVEWGACERAAPLDLSAWQAQGLRLPYLLFVSQFHRYKNLSPLLEAFALARARQPALQLVLAGAAGEPAYWREVEAQIARLDLSASVLHLAHVKRAQLPQLYRAALAFVHPSLAEACPFPLLEALALGVPCAVARAGSLPELAGEAALTFDPHDAQDLAAVLERLLADEALRATLSARAVERAQLFDWQAAAAQTLRVLEQAAEKTS